jgi:hypothetical protein
MMQDFTPMFRLAARAAILAIGVTATVPALAETIRCESKDGRERYCSTNTSRGVNLVTQLSSRGCYQGETWGYDRRGIWVNGGCRAIFETNYYNDRYNYNNNNYNNYNNYHSSNDYYSGNRNNKSNDGAAVAVALAAIIGAAAIASSSSKNKNNSSSYQSNYDRGCDYGRKDRSSGKGRDYYSHSSAYNSESEQAFAAGYNKCWNSN